MKPPTPFGKMRANRARQAQHSQLDALDTALCELNIFAVSIGMKPTAEDASNYRLALEKWKYLRAQSSELEMLMAARGRGPTC